MSFKNFVPTVWAEGISRELERMHVHIADTNRQYEGKVKKQGDSVRILGVGKPTIISTTDKNITLGDAEVVEESAVTMQINQIAYFNYLVDDIDKRQAVGGVMEALNKETSEALADVTDRYVADLVKASEAVKDTTTQYVVDASNVLQKIDEALIKLYENDVKTTGKITITVPPRFYMFVKQAYTALDTDNSKILENGNVGKYGNVIVRMSNNVTKSGSGNLIQIKTDRAIAYCNPMIHTEPYRPESKFADAVKGFILFDAKIVRPKEMIVMNIKY